MADLKVENHLRAYGEFVGRYPKSVCGTGFAVLLALALSLVAHDDIVDGTDFELLWSKTGGRQESDIRRAMRNEPNVDRWAKKTHVTYLVGKGWEDRELGEGPDVLTQAGLQEAFQLYSRFFDLSVETPNGIYTTYDLCARGSLPDKPANPADCTQLAELEGAVDVGLYTLTTVMDEQGTTVQDRIRQLQFGCFESGAPGGRPILPCLVTSPFDCFSDNLQVQHSSYQAIDSTIDQISDYEMYHPMPYANRPSLEDSTDADVKSAVSSEAIPGSNTPGCPSWTRSVISRPHQWGGGVTYGGSGDVTRAEGVSLTLGYDSPERVAFRMGSTKPDLASEADIAAAIAAHGDAWQREVDNFRGSLLDAKNLKPDFEEQMEEAGDETGDYLFLLGLVLATGYISFALSSVRTPSSSRAFCGTMGLLVVALSCSAAFGLTLLLGIKLNVIMLSGLPFLAIGLGVNDFLVLLHCFSSLGEEQSYDDFLVLLNEDDGYSSVIGEVMYRAGPGVLLTSGCNAIAFAFGAALPIPAISNFCSAASLVSLVNLLAMTTVFLPLLTVEAWRIRSEMPELHCITGLLHLGHLKRPPRITVARSAPGEGDVVSQAFSMEKLFVKMCKERFAPLIVQWPTQVGLVLAMLGLVAGTAVSVAMKDVGYNPSELVPRDHAVHDPLALSVKYFTYFRASLVFHDLDVPTHQGEMLELYEDLVTDSDTFLAGGVLPYLTAFYDYINSVGPANEPNIGLDAAQYQHATLAPNGIAAWSAEQWYQLTSPSASGGIGLGFHHWNDMPLENPANAYSNAPVSLAYALADIAGCNSFASTSERGDVNRTIDYSFFELSQVKMKKNDDFVTSIRRTLEVIDNSPLNDNAFVTGDIFIRWEIFTTLDAELIKMFAIDITVMFVFMLAVLRSLPAAITSVLALVMIVLEVYGLCMTFQEFNTFTVGTLLAAAGVSIEFVAHVASNFALGEGLETTTKERTARESIAAAMERTFPALAEGCVAMFILILPSAFHPIPFVVKYQFAGFALVLCVVALNGFVFVPLSLVMLAPLSNRCQGTRVTPVTDISIAAPVVPQPQPNARPVQLETRVTETPVTDISSEELN